ncbi:hypothetical protein [Tenggerimyces flavus]|uniref:Apolipoprotein N-acyltransferase n=1 Tax=Tenggerimyces flavus TaxID=1708749 RepID=A0ABV7YBK8_9ACTN|nr:hypothetical protein [Tenggerimyces flavus]MBM7788826.1 signal transduction histidine kinase [Tenggerimyces flavus]
MDALRRVGPWIGIVLLLPLLIPFLVSGLVMPSWAVIFFVFVWVALVVLALYLFRRKPLVVLALPFAGFAFWLAFWLTGAAIFDWTA